MSTISTTRSFIEVKSKSSTVLTTFTPAIVASNLNFWTNGSESWPFSNSGFKISALSLNNENLEVKSMIAVNCFWNSFVIDYFQHFQDPGTMVFPCALSCLRFTLTLSISTVITSNCKTKLQNIVVIGKISLKIECIYCKSRKSIPPHLKYWHPDTRVSMLQPTSCPIAPPKTPILVFHTF